MELLIVLCFGLALASLLDAISQRRMRKRDRRKELDKRLYQHKG